MHLVVGLGNPGPKYAGNRHNIGFMVVDELASRAGAMGFREKFQGVFAKVSLAKDEAVLLKPMTYMNLSGESVQKAMTFFKVPLESVIVVHDELDLDFADCRIKVGGGLAGHNGLKSIAQHCGGNGFVRIRFGIGRPKHKGADHVLSDFHVDERAVLEDAIDKASTCVESCIALGARAAMNRHHSKTPKKKKKSKPAESEPKGAPVDPSD